MEVKCARELRMLIEDLLEAPRYILMKREDIALHVIKERVKVGIEDLEKCLDQRLEIVRRHHGESIGYAEGRHWDEAIRELGMIASLVVQEVLVGEAVEHA